MMGLLDLSHKHCDTTIASHNKLKEVQQSYEHHVMAKHDAAHLTNTHWALIG
jgi:hypothetical protein